MKILSDVAWAAVSQVFVRGSPIASSIILTHAFNSKEFAAYSFYQSTIAMIASYASAGLGVAASKFFAEFGLSNVKNNSSPIGLVWIIGVFISILGGVLILVGPFDIEFEGSYVNKYTMSLGFFAAGFSVVPSGAIIGLGLHKKSSILGIFVSFFMIFGVLFSAKIKSVSFAIIFIAISLIIQSLGESLFVIKKLGWSSIFKKNQFTIKSIVKIFDVSGAMLIVTLFTASGAWLVGQAVYRSSGAHDFSLYSIGMQWFSVGMFLPGVVGRVIFPEVVKITENDGHLKKLVFLSVLCSMGIALSVFVIFLIFFPWIGLMYGDGFNFGISHMAIFLGAAIFVAPAGVLGNVIIASNRHRVWVMMVGGGFLCMMVVAFIFRGYGVFSGGLSHGAYGLLLTVLSVLYLNKKMKTNKIN